MAYKSKETAQKWPATARKNATVIVASEGDGVKTGGRENFCRTRRKFNMITPTSARDRGGKGREGSSDWEVGKRTWGGIRQPSKREMNGLSASLVEFIYAFFVHL